MDNILDYIRLANNLKFEVEPADFSSELSSVIYDAAFDPLVTAEAFRIFVIRVFSES